MVDCKLTMAKKVEKYKVAQLRNALKAQGKAEAERSMAEEETSNLRKKIQEVEGALWEKTYEAQNHLNQAQNLFKLTYKQ